MIKDLQEWSDALRTVVQEADSPVQHKNGQWRLRDRKAAWFAAGPRVFDQDLERLHAVSLEVLSERDPQFELNTEERFAARMRGKVLRHSQQLRRGMAETLTLLGVFPEALTNVSFGAAQRTADNVVIGILKDADWQRWSSVSDILPLLAEAAPEAFMAAVEGSLGKQPSPFTAVFGQERGGAFGHTYLTGLLWALETLAWSEEYLTRTVVILGGLVELDSGGQWTNRPGNSLTEILLPWLPHTTAPASKRVGAVRALLKNHPDAGWQVLLTLMPNAHRTSSETHRPVWRKLVPDTWKGGVTTHEFWELSEIYASLAIEQAGTFTRVLTLVSRFADLPVNGAKQLTAFLRSRAKTFDPDECEQLWKELLGLVQKHRKFANTNWALSKERVTELEELAEGFKPTSSRLAFKRLFGRDDFDLYDEGTDFDEQERKLIDRRAKAAATLFTEGGAESLIAFASEVETPWQVGYAAGRAALELDARLLPAMLTDDATPDANFVRGFVWARFHDKGWQWVDNLHLDAWAELARAQLLAILPFGVETWQQAARFLPEDGRQFWQRTDANPYRAKTELTYAVQRLLECGRPLEAIACLYYQVHHRQEIDEAVAVQALLKLLENQRLLEKARLAHEVVDIIKALQSSEKTTPEDLFQIEWSYLALLDEFSGGSPVVLQRKLASDPAFFCELVRLLYRSAKEPPREEVEDVDESRKRRAENGYRLLHNWHRPPGLKDDGSLDGDYLGAWITSVEETCKESGHLAVAQVHIGHVLMHAPADPSGLWIHKAAAAVLNAADADEMRSGYHCEWFNTRGAYWGSGGKEELKLAATFKEKAAAVESEGFIRLGTTLRDLAKSYEHDAARSEVREN